MLLAQTSFTLRIDPENARGGSASQIFESIEFIPLETTSESLFGSIDQMEVTDDYFFILDTRSKSILVFNKDGRLHTRIRSGGSDKYFGYFTLDRIDKRIIVYNQFSNGLLVYDFDGKPMGKEPFPDGTKSLYYFGKIKCCTIYPDLSMPIQCRKIHMISHTAMDFRPSENM